MKKLNKISILLFLLLGITFTSCETTELDLLDDPNNVTLDKADLERYLVAIQVDFKSFVETMGRNGAQLTRVEYMFGRTYLSNYSAENTNFEWGLAYQRMFSDMKAAELVAVPNEETNHIAVMKIIKAYTLMTLVDFYGDVPLSQATNPTEFPFPGVDSGSSVYAASIVMLDEAIAYLNDGLGGTIANDLYYDNDYAKWEKLANTLKMRAYLNTRLVDSEARTKFNQIVNTGNYIMNSEDDFQFRYGTSQTDPDTRHPAYAADYAVSGAGRYRSNWLMNTMVENDDPRRYYYFFRQVACTPGFGTCPASPTALFCSTQSRPQHYPSDMVYCNVDRGYWGRDHGNDEGIPPDSFKRTAVGIYPSGGKFDHATNRDGTIDLNDNTGLYEFNYTEINDSAGQEGGLLGAGITPIVLSSSVDFWRAEMALSNGQVGAASQLVQSAIEKSMGKVIGDFSATSDPGYDANLILDDVVFDPATGNITSSSTSGDLTPSISDGMSFANAQANLINDTSESSWNVLAEQFFVNQYGNGIDTYNFYRRTGFPTSLQFNVESASGNFVRSFLYAADEANTNNNIDQKPNVDVKVFWDNNPNSPGFPFAN